MRLNLDKHLRIKISDKSFAQCYDVAMTSISSFSLSLENDVMATKTLCKTFIANESESAHIRVLFLPPLEGHFLSPIVLIVFRMD